jgi:hypothetical protein
LNFEISSKLVSFIIEKSIDEDGIKKKLQRAGGCCEPVLFLNMPSPSELAAEDF